MKPLDVFFLIGTLLSLFWGYKSYVASRAELDRIRNRKRLPRLRKELALIERLHSSPGERIEYLLQAALFSLVILGVALMTSSFEFLAKDAAFAAGARWSYGVTIFLFCAYRLNRCTAATVNYENTKASLTKAIADSEANA